MALFCPMTALAEDSLLERDVLPILARNCLGCHGGLVKEGGLDLRTLPAMLKGGESGPAIEKGAAARSELWKQIASDNMPAGDDREKLSPADKALIKRWIDDGLPTVSERQKDVDPLLTPGQVHKPLEVATAIDRHVESFLQASGLQAVGVCDDEAFLRRVTLDLSGHVPTAAEAVSFLDSKDQGKRQKLVETLLAKPDFGRQFGRTWREWICPPELPSNGNAGNQPYGQARAMGDWIGKKITAGDSWAQITREILTVQGKVGDHPQGIFYALVGRGGGTTADGSARAVARLFMGVQLQCARCHDDPYRDWAQSEHWGLAAFFGRSRGDFEKIEIGKGDSKKPGVIAIPGSAFKNQGQTIKAAFLRGAEYKVTRTDDLRPALADWLLTKENRFFSSSFVNRAWFYLFARGIVNPIDDFRDLNPPSHPGLMKMLSAEFAASNFDIKHLFRCLCNSRAYQRTSRLAPGGDARARSALTTAFGRMPMRLMTADVLYDSLKRAYGDDKLDLRTTIKDSTVGMAAPVGDAWLEFQRRFGINEEDATDFTHGVAQMLTMINHPRLHERSKSLDAHLKKNPQAEPDSVIEWLYLSTLSRRPTATESAEARAFVDKSTSRDVAFDGVLWMLVNRSEFLLIR
tara:strand:+ start:42 stop:1940 length:1899 start_codon:yes stop_codon:yes gene_type:complete